MKLLKLRKLLAKESLCRARKRIRNALKQSANECKDALPEIEKCEPVAMVNKNNPHRPYLQELSGVFKLENGTKLYTSQQPREWVGLSDDELKETFNSADYKAMVTIDDVFFIAARAIEAKLKQLNTKG